MYNKIELGKYIEYSNENIDEPTDTKPDLHDTDKDYLSMFLYFIVVIESYHMSFKVLSILLTLR